MVATNLASVKRTETEIAVLQIQYENLNEKVEEIRDELKEIRKEISIENAEVKILLENIEKSSNLAHVDLNKKISALEKWRWMLMGAGVVIGALGFETIGKLLK